MAVGRSPAHLADRADGADRAVAGQAHEVDRTAPAHGNRGELRGILAAGLLCMALAWATAVRLPVFFGADERTHFGYVVYVVEGRLPEVRDPLPTADDRFPVLARSMDYDRVPDEHTGPMVNVANHPPLLYAIAALPTWLASLVGADTLPPLTVRLINGLFMGVGVVVIGLLARRLFPRIPGVGILAAGVAAVTPNLVGVAAYGHNDGFAFALAATALLVAVRLLQDGPQTRLVGIATAVAVACAFTRASLVVAAVGLASAAVIGGVRQRSPGWPQHLGRLRPSGQPGYLGRLRRGWSALRAPRPWAAGAVVAGSVALLTGWFYWRNQQLYGSPTADGVLLDAFQRVPRGSLLDVLRDREFHAEMWTKLYGSVHPELAFGRLRRSLAALVVVGVAGSLVGLWRHRARVATTAANGSEPGDDMPRGIGTTGWALLAAYSTVVTVTVADFVSKGGSMHPRYFFALVPLTSTLLAAAVAQLPFRRVIGLATVAGLLAMTAGQLRRYEGLIERRRLNGFLLLPDRPAGIAVQWLVLGVAAVAFVVLVVELLRTRAGAGEEPSGPSPAPATPTTRSALAALDGSA